MKNMIQWIRYALLALTLITLSIPFIDFYGFREGLFDGLLFYIVYFVLLIVGTFFTYFRRKSYGSQYFSWSFILFLVSILVGYIPIKWIRYADAMVLMPKREEIVREIKKLSREQRQSYRYTGFIPISMGNHITIIEDKAANLAIYFQTTDDGFLDISYKGVMYSEQQALTPDSGEKGTARTSFRMRKIKPNWYFYEHREGGSWD